MRPSPSHASIVPALSATRPPLWITLRPPFVSVFACARRPHPEPGSGPHTTEVTQAVSWILDPAPEQPGSQDRGSRNFWV
jgi:hypothetical protein